MTYDELERECERLRKRNDELLWALRGIALECAAAEDERDPEEFEAAFPDMAEAAAGLMGLGVR